MTEHIIQYRPELVLIVTPNAALPGATKAREELAAQSIPAITLSDGPSKKAFIGKDDGKPVSKGGRKPGVYCFAT